MRILTQVMLTLFLTGGMAVAAQAADLVVSDPVNFDESQTMIWDGLYVGVAGGEGLDTDGVGSYGTVGIVAGGHFSVSDGFLLGGELQLSSIFYDGIFDGSEWLALGHVGFAVNESVFVYGALGGGKVKSIDAIAIGGGIEFAAYENLSVRGEVLRVFDPAGYPAVNKVNAGVLFHF